MIEIVNLFKKETYNDDVFGSTVFVSAIFAVLDLLIRTRQLKIVFPIDFITISISAKFEHILATSPCLALLIYGLFNITMSRSYIDKDYQEKSLIQYYSILTSVCLIYALYRFFTACGLIISEQAIEPSFLDNSVIRILLVVISYFLIFIFFAFTTMFKVAHAHSKREKWDISSLKTNKDYNTMTFQFDNKLSGEQINEIIMFIKNVVLDKSDANLATLYLVFESALYFNINEDSLTLGQIDKEYDSANIEQGVILSFWVAIEQLNNHLTELQYKYHMTISNEKYIEMPITISNPWGVGNINIVKYK